MPTYIPNVTDKQQSDIERAADEGQTQTEGKTKMVPAYDLSNTTDAGASPNDAVAQVSRAHMVIGSHNDKPHRFSEPGRA